MFDTMTMTKIVGGFCGAFLVFLLLNWGGETLYHVGAEDHGEGEHQQAYVIEAEETGGGEEAAGDAPLDITPLLASADVAAGEKVFGKCKACHHLDGQEAAGPHLNGVIGRDIASVPGYGYSAALTELAGNWDPQPFSEFLTNPTGYAPGTKMAIKLPKPEERANLIAYLQTQP
jgi:cytochrome c